MRATLLCAAVTRVRKSIGIVLSLCVLGGALAGCGGNDGSDGNVQSALPAAVTGPDGASVRMRTLRREPAQQATIRVARDSSGAPVLDARFTPLGSIYQYTPHGWIEDEIEIRVPFHASEGGESRLMIAQPGGRWTEVVGAKREGSFMVGRVVQLGYAVVVTTAQGSSLGGRISALAARIGALSEGETSPLTVTIGAGTAPAMPAAEAGAWPKVATTTDLALDINYDLPSCSARPVAEVVGMTWHDNLQDVRYVNLGRRELSGVGGTEVYRMPLTAAENGNWVFIAYVWCKEPDRAEVSYSMTAYSAKFTVDIVGVTPVPAPAIGAHPESRAVIAGGFASFNVSAQGTSLVYEWQRSNDGGASYNPIAGAATAAYGLSTSLADDGALFRVRVTNAGGAVMSTPAMLTVSAITVAPIVTNDPSNQSVLEGESATFTVAGTGQPAPVIQWQWRAGGATTPEAGWSDVVGASGNSYTVVSTSATQSNSQFRAVLRNTAGASTSNPANLTVTARQFAPVITTAPIAADVVAGQLGLFSLVATGTTPLSYQWYKNGEPIVGANGPEVVVLAQNIDVGSSYQIAVRVSNAVGEATSASVPMRVIISGTQIPAAQGGTVNGPAGSSLVIPPGALGSDATVNVTPIAVGASDIPPEMVVVGDAVRIQPVNLAFQQPALLQLPAPADLPVGMTFAVLRLESLEDDGTGTSVQLSASANLRRAAKQGATSLAGRITTMRFRTPGTLPCENPLNIDADGKFGKLVSQAGSYLTVMTPVSLCSSVQPTISTPELPSNTERKCVNDADFWPMNGDPGEDLRALVSRHVDCRMGTSYSEVMEVELVESNGSYRLPTQSDPVSSIGYHSPGTASFRVKMATFGPYNELSKRVSVTVEVVSFMPNPDYRGPDRTPTMVVRPQILCGSSYEDSSVTPSCAVSGADLLLELQPGATATGEYTVNFSWPARPAPEKDVLTFQLFPGRFEYAAQGAPFLRVRGDASYFSPRLGNSVLVRCDNRVAHATSRGCVFPQAAAVFVQRLSGAGVDENSTHIAEAQGRGAPGVFRMKPGFRAIADDSVQGSSALHRTQIEFLRAANSDAACIRAWSIINVTPRASTSCPNGSTDGTCQCDEYPFASTYEGAFSVMPNLPVTEVPPTASAKYILRGHNATAGSALGDFYLKQRVLDLSILTGQPGPPSNPDPAYSRIYGGDSFWVKINP